MNNIDHLKSLNLELNSICNKVCDSIYSRPNPDPFMSISLGFLIKCNKTLQSVNLLYENNLPEQAQIIIRVLLELRLNFDCFLIMSDHDIVNTCHRIIDSMMLEKIKQAKASGFKGISEEMRQKLKVSEQKIKGNYSEQEFKKMKRYGFTGLNIEQRAHLTSKEDEYNIVFRNFSRNVHSTDYMENIIAQGRWGDFDDYIQSRDLIGVRTTFFSASGIILRTNQIFQCGFDSEINFLVEEFGNYNQG